MTQQPSYRFWGSRKPPESRSNFWAVSSTPKAAEPGSVATLRMYGPIDSWGGFWGISAKDVSAALDSLGEDVSEVRVRINSPGGEVWEGMTILNILRAHPARVVAVVDGLAASAASVIATGCDETVMSPGTQLMIHDASGICLGQSSDMAKMSATLDSVSDSLAAIYAESAGGDATEWRAAMRDETWYTAAEAVTAGLADRIGVVPDSGATATSGAPEAGSESDPTDMFDLSIFNYAGRSASPPPRVPNPPSASASGSSNTTQEGSLTVDFTADQLTTMRQALGVAEDADGATLVAAMSEALTERADPAATHQSIPEGHVTIPAVMLDELQVNAALGAQAADQLRIQARESFLDSVRAKFVPANRAAWAKEYDRDPEGTRAHFATQPDIINLVAVGHDQQPETTQDDADFAALFGEGN